MTTWGRRGARVFAAMIMVGLTGCGGAVSFGAGDGGAQSSSDGATPSTPVAQPLFITNVIAGPYCLPQPLPLSTPSADGGGATSCYVLEALAGTSESVCADQESLGLSIPDPSLLASVRAATSNEPGTPAVALCQVAQLVPPAGESCATSTSPGWCYVTGANAAALDCAQTIQFAPNTLATSTTLWLACY